MKISQKQKLILAIVLFLITGFVLYRTFSPSSPVADVVSNAGEIILQPTNENQDIIDLANKFETVGINIDFFKSSLFLSLRDLTVPLYPEVFGRPNPFSPIGIEGSKSISPITTTIATTSVKSNTL